MIERDAHFNRPTISTGGEAGARHADHRRWVVGRDKGFHSPDIEAWRERIERQFMRLSRVPHDRLTWMTVISTAIVVSPADHSSTVRATIVDVERRIRSRCRRKLPGMRIRAVHEIDLLTGNACNIGPHKAKTIADLGVDSATVGSDDRVLLVHIHCLIDRGVHSPTTLTEEFRAEFPGCYRVMGKPLTEGCPVDVNVKRLASYCGKMKPAYSDAWGNRPTRYSEVFEPEWVNAIEDTIRGVGLDNLIFALGDLVPEPQDNCDDYYQLHSSDSEDFCGFPDQRDGSEVTPRSGRCADVEAQIAPSSRAPCSLAPVDLNGTLALPRAQSPPSVPSPTANAGSARSRL